MRNSKYFSEFMLLMMTVIWGGSFFVIKIALRDISPMMFVLARFTAASLLFLPFACKSLKGLSRGSLLSGIFLGLVMGIGFIAQTVGLKYTSATKSGFLTGTVVIFTPVFQVLIEKKRPSAATIAGSGVVLAGLVFLSAGDTSFLNVFREIGSGFNTGDYLSLAGALFFALYIVMLDIYSKKIEILPLVFLQIISTAALAAASVSFFGVTRMESPHAALSTNLVLALIYTAVMATIITTIIQTQYQKNVTPAKAGIIYTFEPVFSAVFAFIFLSERLSDFAFAGCILIAAGLIISEGFKNNK